MILDVVRQLVKERVEPRAAEIDAGGEFPWDIKQLFAENDLLGIPFPAEYGGVGSSFVTYVKVVEEVAKACASSALIIAVQELGALPILIGGTDEQKRRWIPQLATGAKIAAYALTEPGSGSDAAGSMRTRAQRDGDDWLLDGTKIWITQGSVADVVTVFAVTDAAKGANGISAFVIEKGTAGFVVGKSEKKMGIRGSPTNELVFENCRVPAANMLGPEGQGFKIAMKVLDKSRPGIAAQALGIARAAFEAATSYAGERRQFDKPIRDFEAIQFKLANMATRIAASRTLLHAAARAKDAGDTSVIQAASMAKLFASETAMWVATEAIQVFGGYGYMKDYPVEKLFRDAKITEIYEGTSEIQRIVIARELYA